MGDLPVIPRAYMTGVQTYIDGQGQTMDTSRTTQSQVIQDDDDTWPLQT